MSNLDLCNTDAYFNSKSSDESIKRVPRSTEDIEVLGLIDYDLNLNFPNSCSLHNISSLTLSFRQSVRKITIKGDKPENPINERYIDYLAQNKLTTESSEEELEKLREKDPLRFLHGWYTINPDYRLGVLSTNGEVKLDSLGFNNERTQCSSFESVNDTIIANTNINANKMIFQNSKSYNSQLLCNILETNNYTCDNMIFDTISGTIKNSKLLDCTINTQNISSDNNRYIGCNINIENADKPGSFENDILYTTLVLSDNSTGIFNNLNVSGSNISLYSIIMNAGLTFNESSIIANTLNTKSNIEINKSTLVVDSGKNIDITIDSSSVGQFKSVDNLILTNDGFISITDTIVSSERIHNQQNGLVYSSSGAFWVPIGYSIDGEFVPAEFEIDKRTGLVNGTIVEYSIGSLSDITNNPLGLLNIKSAIVSQGQNNGSIQGSLFSYYTSFNNYGTISSDMCILYAAGNQGTILNAFLIDKSINNGLCIEGNFFGESINNATVSVGHFYDNSINNNAITKNTQAHMLAETYCKETSSLFFYDNATNSGELFCPDTTYSFYGNSSSYGSYIYSASFYENSDLNGDEVLVESVALFDNSTCSASPAYILREGLFNNYSRFDVVDLSSSYSDVKLEINNSVFGEKIILPTECSGLSITLNNSSHIKLITGSVESPDSTYDISIKNSSKLDAGSGNFVINFFDNSMCGNSSSRIILNNNSSATGTLYNELNMKDTSFSTSLNCSVNVLVMSDDAVFLGDNIIAGLIKNNAKASNSYLTFNILSFDQKASNSSSLIGAGSPSSLNFVYKDLANDEFPDSRKGLLISGSPVVTLSDPPGISLLQTGMTVIGVGISANTTIISIDSQTRQITLSNNATITDIVELNFVVTEEPPPNPDPQPDPDPPIDPPDDNQNQPSYNLFFDNGSQQTSGSITNAAILFTNNSFNAGLINDSVAYFENNTSHRGSGSNHTLYFKPGSINLGYADTAYFYAGSSNAGIVKNGIFHPSVSQTGIVLNSYIQDDTLN